MMKHDQDDAMIKVLYEASLQGSVENFNSLIQRDQLVLHKISLTSLSETPLHISALRGDLEFTRALLTHKPKLAFELDSLKRLPLHLAAAEGHTEVVKALLAAVARAAAVSCKATDEDGRTPLHLAAMRGRVEVMQELMRLCPESILEKVDGFTALHLCVQYNHLEALKLLVEVSKSNRHEFILNEMDLHGYTILHQAVMLKRVKTVEYLLSEGVIRAKANEPDYNKSLLTTLEPQEDPRDYKSLQIQDLLDASGAFKLVNHQRPQQTTNWTPKKLVKPQQHCSDWIKETRGSLMIVATVIATIAFQDIVNPPGGVWEEDSTTKGLGCSKSTPCHAGTAVVAYLYPKRYYMFLLCNTVSFATSLGVVLMLISGLPMWNKFFMWALTLTMMTSVTFTTVSYLMSIVLVSPNNLFDYVSILFGTIVSVWVCMLGVLGLFLVARFIYWVVKKCIRNNSLCMH